MPSWTAKLVVDEPLVRRLLAQFPELDPESLRPFAEGWDSPEMDVYDDYDAAKARLEAR